MPSNQQNVWHFVVQAVSSDAEYSRQRRLSNAASTLTQTHVVTENFQRPKSEQREQPEVLLEFFSLIFHLIEQ